jgi:hypothetical protein
MKRMACLVSLILSALLWSVTVYATDCDDDTIRSVSNDGEIIVTNSGHVYDVMAGDEIDSALWLPISDILVCEHVVRYQGRLVAYYEIINTDEGEKVGALKLR